MMWSDSSNQSWVTDYGKTVIYQQTPTRAISKQIQANCEFWIVN